MNEKKAYNQLDHSGTYREDDTSVTLTVLGGTYGGGRRYLSYKTCYRKASHPRNANEAQGYAETEVNDTLNIFDNGEMRTPTLIVEEIKAISFQERAGKPGGGKGILIQKERVGALSTLCNQYVYENHQQDGRIKPMGEINETISQKYGTGGNNTPLVVEEGDDRTLGLDRASYNQGANAQFGFSVEEEKIGAQTAKGPGAVCERVTSIVRRLTPTECELLQGFPKGWTDIGDWTDSKGKVHKGDSDAPRYKALGNSIAVGFANNCSGFWMWLMKRISAQYERSATLGSLFDGISGFPLAWAKYNGPENCRWSSEIEEFPIAVCKKHFGDEDNGIEGDIRKYL